DPETLQQLDESARGHVIIGELTAAGISDLGEIGEDGRRPDVVCNGMLMTLAQWPNDHLVEIVDVPMEEPIQRKGVKGDKSGKIIYMGERPSRWLDEPDAYAHGYWFYNWWDSYHPIVDIDPEKHTLQLGGQPHGYGYRAHRRYRVLNALVELDEPGEYYIDRREGMLYLWPPDDASETVEVTVLEEPLIAAENVSNLRLEGFTLECCRGSVLSGDGCENVTVSNCTVRHVGSDAITFEGGRGCRVEGCEIYGIGGTGVTLRGGNREDLTSAHHIATDNHIHDFGRWRRTYHPAVNLRGVGNTCAHNHIHDAPHAGITAKGNEHVIEYNEVHHVATETGDVGAFYICARDWTMRGTIIRHNYFHDVFGLGMGSKCVYLDDFTSGHIIFGNVFEHVARAAFVGGGRDNIIQNNLFIACFPSVRIDARGTNWAKGHLTGSDTWDGVTLFDRLQEMDYHSPPYSDRYPELLTVVDDEPAMPKGNRVARNISLGGRWCDLVHGITEEIVRMEDNLICGHADVSLRDAAAGRLESIGLDSDAVGFQPIPLDRIGPQENIPPAEASE
ncbi:MAG: right-handed parallel beta-helix repeat-containing protein, partial [Armatimonadota bacterium]